MSEFGIWIIQIWIIRDPPVARKTLVMFRPLQFKRCYSLTKTDTVNKRVASMPHCAGKFYCCGHTESVPTRTRTRRILGNEKKK